MTAPLDDDPREGLPTTTGHPLRELSGLLLVVAGLIAVLAVLATVDVRLAVAAGGALAVAGGLLLGRIDEGS